MNHMLTRSRYITPTFFRACVLLASFSGAIGLARPASAQEFPGWQVTQQSSDVDSTGVTIAAVPIPAGGQQVLAVGQTGGALNQAYSTDGQTYIGSTYITAANGQGNYNQYYDINCTTSTLCNAGVIYYNGAIYVAFADSSSKGLTVVKGTPIGSSSTRGGYQFNTVFTNTGVTLTSPPAMVITPSGSLLIRYGTSNNSSEKNETFTTTYNSASNVWTNYQNTGGLAPTQSALINFNGTIYAIDKQDNSSNGVFVSKVDNTGTTIANTQYQVSGWYTGSGISAMVYKGSIVAAVQQDASSHYMYVFSSTDGANWSAKEYSNRLNFTPSICVFNGGASLATVANDSSYYLYTSFVTN